jgi:DNA primase large subunit
LPGSLVRLRDYPFLVDLDDFALRELGFRVTFKLISSDPRIAELSLDTIRAAVAKKAPPNPTDSVEAVLSFYLALGISKLLGASVVEALARFLSENAYKSLQHVDDDELVGIAEKAGLPVKRGLARLRWSLDRGGRIRYKTLPFKVPVSAYLSSIIDTSNPKLSLVNQMLLGGYVYLDREKLVLLLKERFYRIIRKRAENIDPSDIPEELISKARYIYEKAMRERSGLSWIPEAVPPCVKSAVTSISRGTARDEQVYLAATFIGALSLTEEEVGSLLNLPLSDWRVKGLVALSREASKQGYTVYTCETLRRLGLCPEVDSCKASNPLREYLRRARRHGGLGGQS